jgi:hypothetical protein
MQSKDPVQAASTPGPAGHSHQTAADSNPQTDHELNRDLPANLQHPCYFHMPLLPSHRRRSLAIIIHQRDIRPMPEQQLHHRPVPILRRRVRRNPSSRLPRVHRRSVLQQTPRRLQIPRRSRRMQRHHLHSIRSHSIHRRPCRNQDASCLSLSKESGKMQRGKSIRRPRIDKRACTSQLRTRAPSSQFLKPIDPPERSCLKNIQLLLLKSNRLRQIPPPAIKRKHHQTDAVRIPPLSASRLEFQQPPKPIRIPSRQEFKTSLNIFHFSLSKVILKANQL